MALKATGTGDRVRFSAGLVLATLPGVARRPIAELLLLDKRGDFRLTYIPSKLKCMASGIST